MDETTVNAGAESSPAPSMADQATAWFSSHLGEDEAAASPDPETPASPETASDGGTVAPAQEDPRSPMIPRQRFDEVNNRAREYQQQLQQLEPVQQLAQQLQARGMTLDQALQQIQQPQAPAPPAQTPESRFAAYLGELGYGDDDLASLDTPTYHALQAAFQANEVRTALQGELNQLQQARQQAEEQRYLQSVQSELASTQEAFPAFKSGLLKDTLLAAYGATGRPMAELAQGLMGEIETLNRNQLALAATQLQQDGKRPSMTGGAPVPVAVDTSKMDRFDLEKAARDHLAGSFNARR